MGGAVGPTLRRNPGMFLTRKHLSRRTLLKGVGASLGLPLLDAMIPAGTALAQTAAALQPQLGFVYFPHGALQDEWQPKKIGRDFDFRFILKPTDSLLDYVKESTASLNRKFDAADRTRVSEYLDSVREIEIRVQKLEASMASLSGLPDAPLGAPEDFGEHLDIQFEMMALAFQTNRTNVASMRMVREASMRVYKNLGISEAFHPTSHWGGFPERIANLRLIQNYHTAIFAKFVERLRNMPDGNGSMLDHSIILFGSNMANSDAHNVDPLPQMLVGRGGGVKGGQHVHYPQDTPHANILVTILDRAGVPAEDFKNFADSTGPFSEV